MNKNSNWTNEEDNIILNNWSNINRIGQLVELIPNRNYNAIKARCTFLKLKIRNFYKDDNFFNQPNMLNNYWAAMVSTDGYVGIPYDNGISRGGYRLQLALKTSDRYHIERFQKDTKTNYKIYRTVKDTIIKTKRDIVGRLTHSDMSGIYFYSAEKWIKDLNKHWGIPFKNKTFNLKRPNITNIYHCLSYIKGLIDGDGTISMSTFNFKLVDGENGHFDNMRIDFLGTQDLLLWVKEITDKILGFNERNTRKVRLERKDSNIFNYRISGVDAIVLFRLLKEINTPYLIRKWNNPRILNLVNKEMHRYEKYYILAKNKINSLDIPSSQPIISI